MLLRQLPLESATKTALRDGEQAWTVNDYLTAAAVDAIRAGNWQRAGGKGKRPKPLPRPGTVDRERVRSKKGMSIDEYKQRIAQPWRDAGTVEVAD